MANDTVSHTTDSRFPRAAVVLEAARVADVLRCAAAALDALAADATSYAPGTLRRKARAIRIEAANILLDIDGGADAEVESSETPRPLQAGVAR